MENKIIKELKRIVREDYSVGGNIDGVNGLLFKYDTLDKKELKLEQFILTKLKEERIKTLEGIPRKGVLPPKTDFDDGYNQKCREISDYIIDTKTQILKDKMSKFDLINNLKK